MRHNFDEIINRRASECKKYEAACYPEDVLPMWIADTDFAVPAEISEAIQQRAKHPCFGYPIESFEFEEAAARWERVRFGWNVNPHWVKYANGVLPFLSTPSEPILIPATRWSFSPRFTRPSPLSYATTAASCWKTALCRTKTANIRSILTIWRRS